MTDPAPRIFTIDRATWLNGGSSHHATSFLLLEGRRCCLGFVGQQCGFRDGDMSLQPGPQDTCTVAGDLHPGLVAMWPAALQPIASQDIDKESPLALTLMGLNDTPLHVRQRIALPMGHAYITLSSQEERESWLQIIAATHGIHFAFEGEYPPDTQDAATPGADTMGTAIT